MNNQNKTWKAVSWFSRILTLLFAAFVSVFALDVFSERLGLFEIVSHLLIHLVPAFLILVILAFSWRREWIGGVAFFLLGIAYIILSWNRFGPFAYPAIWAPLIILGLLNFFSWQRRKKMT